MIRWTDKETGIQMCEPDCAEEWLWSIWAIGCDYDGCNDVDSLKGLVDELVEMAQKGRECLRAGRIFIERD